MATQYNLSLIIKNPSNEDEFLLVKQNPPPKFNDPEYDSFSDSPLWDFPSSPLLPLDSPSDNQFSIQVPESCSDEVDLSKFDLNSAIHKVTKEILVAQLVGFVNFRSLLVMFDFTPCNPLPLLNFFKKKSLLFWDRGIIVVVVSRS